MKAKLFLSISLCLSIFFVGNIDASVPTLLDPVGTYEFTVTDIPDMDDVKGTMVVSKDGSKIKVKFSSSTGELELADAKLDGNKLTGTIDTQGIILKLKGTFTSDGFDGQLDTEYGAMGVTATKK